MIEVAFWAGIICGMLVTGIAFFVFLFLFPHPPKGPHG